MAGEASAPKVVWESEKKRAAAATAPRRRLLVDLDAVLCLVEAGGGEEEFSVTGPETEASIGQIHVKLDGRRPSLLLP